MIVNVDLAAIEVRRQKEGAVQQGEALVNRAAGGVIEGHHSAAGAGPVGDDAILGIKNERSAAEVAAVAVGHGSGRAARAAITVWIFCGPGYGHHQRILVALWVVERGCAAVIIGNPEILPGKNGDSPRVQELSVCGSGYAGSIGDQISLEIAGLLGAQHRSTSQCHEKPE